MKKPATTIGIGATALAIACMFFSPSASADPEAFPNPVGCPDPQANNPYFGMSYEQASVVHQQTMGQADVDYANWVSSCAQQGFVVDPNQPIAYPEPPKPPSGDPGWEAINALGSPQSVDVGPDPSIDCEGMYNSQTNLDALNIAGDRVADLHAKGIPGLSQIQSAPQAVCALVNAGINQFAPNPNAAEQASTGGCNMTQMILNSPVDLCGNGRPAS